MFNSKYPIVAVGMNQVSNINLALAVSRAGAVPTISAFNYQDQTFHFDKLNSDFDFYRTRNQNCDFIFSLNDQTLIENRTILEIIKNFNIKYIELISTPEYVNNNFIELNKILRNLKMLGVYLLIKTVVPPLNTNSQWLNYINDMFDGIIIKSSYGAGRIFENSNLTTIELTKICLARFPNKKIIPCGGVSAPKEVKNLLEAGACAVGVGTLFAAAFESPLSENAKKQMITASSKNIKKLNTHDFKQNTLVFSHIDQNIENNTEGLKKGIETGSEGHVFAGSSIDHITEIKSVKDIVEDLCSLL